MRALLKSALVGGVIKALLKSALVAHLKNYILQTHAFCFRSKTREPSSSFRCPVFKLPPSSNRLLSVLTPSLPPSSLPLQPSTDSAAAFLTPSPAFNRLFSVQVMV